MNLERNKTYLFPLGTCLCEIFIILSMINFILSISDYILASYYLIKNSAPTFNTWIVIIAMLKTIFR